MTDEPWHKTDKSTYMRLVAEDFLTDRWWIAAVTVAALLTAGYYAGPVWYMVLLVVACLVAPALLAVLFINYSLTPEAVAAIRPNRIDIDPKGNINVTFRPDDEREYAPYCLSADDIAGIEERTDFKVVRIKGRPYRYIIIPLSNPTES